MRSAFLYIDTGGGWENHTGHEDDQAALAGLTVTWGNTDPEAMPETNVLHFQLRDRTGSLAGRAMTLLDSRVLLQLTRTPNWGDLLTTAPYDQQWRESEQSWATLHEPYEPDPESPPDPAAVTLFQGTLTTGGTVTEHPDHWLLDLYAQSITVQADRDTTTGPTATDSRPWTGTPTGLLEEIRARLTSLGVWDVDETDAQRLIDITPDALAGWDADDTPSLTDALDQLTSWRPELYRWHEWHDTKGDRLRPIPVAAPARMVMHSDGHMTVSADMLEYDVIPGSSIQLDGTRMEIPDPVTGITLKAIVVETKNGERDYKDTETRLDATSLPTALKTHGENTVRETRIVTNGTWPRDKWTPGATDMETADRYARSVDMRLRPEGITIDSRRISVDDYPSVFAPQPSLWGFIQNRYTRLLSDDGQPSAAGAWLATAGTLMFKRANHKPIWSNQLTITPLPMRTSQATWADLRNLPGTYSQQQLTWSEIQLLEYQE